MSGGPPTTYTQELADRICELLAEGHSLNAICRREGMPNKTTVFRWRKVNPDFKAAYAEAREFQAEGFYDELLDIADDASGDWVDTEDGKELDREHLMRSKVRLEMRMWAIARILPKQYSDKPHHQEKSPEADGLVIEIVDINEDDCD